MTEFAPWFPDAGPEPAQCAWCGVGFSATDLRLHGRIQCARCGVATTSPWPNGGQLEAAYGDWYRPPEGRFGSIGDRILQWSRSRLARRLDRLAPPGPILDVGSGDGTLLRALTRRGRTAVGLERGDTSRLGGGDIRDVDITEVDGQWAAVVFWHSLEHLAEPRAALAHAAQLLAPGGVLVVALPNSESRQAAAFGDRWFALDLPRHLVQVPAGTLRSTLHDLGLGTSRVSHLRGGQVLFGWIHGLVAMLPGHPDLYDAIRTPQARSRPMTSRQRLTTLGAAALAGPLALAGAGLEVAGRRGGSIYIEARR